MHVYLFVTDYIGVATAVQSVQSGASRWQAVAFGEFVINDS